jgi:hypothetical protein
MRFPRRDALRASAWQGRTRAEAFHSTTCINEGPWPKGDMLGLKPKPSLRACGARPSAGRAIQGKMAYRGKVGDDAKCGFLGGTHSVRPRGKAIRKPRHIICAGPLMICRWPNGAIHR